jgi:RHS repeat-associated protein
LTEFTPGGLEQNMVLSLLNMDEPIERTTPTGVHETLLTDHLQSAIAAYDDAGSVIRSTEFNAFGTVKTGADPGPIGFHGARQLGKTGLLYLRNRVYDPSLHRFLSRDAIGFAGGWNQFAFADNNPGRRRDPLGLQSMEDHLGVKIYDKDPDPPRDPEEGLTEDQRAARRLLEDFGGVHQLDPTAGPIGFMVMGVGIRPWQRYGGCSSTLPTRSLDEAFNASLFQDIAGTYEVIAGIRVFGVKGLVGTAFSRTIYQIEAVVSRPGAMYALMRYLEAEARAAGATALSIVGHSVINKGLLSPAIIRRLERMGFSYRQVNETTIYIFKPLK